MITINFLDSEHCAVFRLNRSIGYISIRYNPYHAQNAYLSLELTQYDPSIAKTVFQLLRSKLSHPLQVMLYAHEIEKCAFLLAGGFQKKRQCCEVNVSSADLISTVKECVPITQNTRTDPAYQDCCKLLYDSYTEKHKAINPFTAGKDLFYAELPDTVIFYRSDDKIVHFAFIEQNEIAYIGTSNQSNFSDFAQTLLARILAEYDSVSFECDDCDLPAMQLKAFFHFSDTDSYDTYVLE